MSSTDALAYVMAHAGASLVRDSVDKYILDEVASYGTNGALISDEGEVAAVLSPPMTPDVQREGGGALAAGSIRARFERVDTEELSAWAAGRGKWLYV